MGKVIPIGGFTRLDLEPDVILENLKGNLDSFCLVGFDKEGELFYSSTVADGGEILWMIEKMKHALMHVGGD